jgi:putative transposase
MARAYYSEIHLHFVWHTKNNEPLLTPDLEKEAHELVRQKALETRGVIVHEVGGTEDHIHIAVTVPPTLTPATFVGQIKGASSFTLGKLHPARPFAWQGGYGVVSFGTKGLPWVVQYIRNQKKHHAEKKQHERLERTDTPESEEEIAAALNAAIQAELEAESASTVASAAG